MKTLLFISLIIGFSGCVDRIDQADKSQAIIPSEKVQPATETGTLTKVPSNNQNDKSKYYTTLDEVVIPTEIGDTLRYPKQEFNDIIDNNPELTSDYPQNPYILYECEADKEKFSGPAGRGVYYMLYAYFLKNKNGVEAHAERRTKLIEICLNINSLFAHIERGGSYFSHQMPGVLGYAEYSVYSYKNQERGGFSKTYDITKQKELHIKSLRQLISDEAKTEPRISQGELNKIVDDIDNAITERFYLLRAQNFHYDHYEYY